MSDNVKLSDDQKALIYQALVETFIQSGADNYLSLIMSYDAKDEYEILIRKTDGKTEAQKNTELECYIAELEKDRESSYIKWQKKYSELKDKNSTLENQLHELEKEQAQYDKMLHDVANKYDGDDNTEWSIGANYVFALFAKWVASHAKALKDVQC